MASRKYKCFHNFLPEGNLGAFWRHFRMNGPAWSLFFEYVANLLYALVVRKFSNWLLALFVFA